MAVTDLNLAGTTVQSTLIEYTVRLQLSDVYFAVIKSPFTLSVDGELLSFVPDEDDDATFDPVRRLVGKTVRNAVVDDANHLKMCFTDGTYIDVPPDPDYEAWTVSGPRGFLVVSMPGGELAEWTARDDGKAAN